MSSSPREIGSAAAGSLADLLISTAAAANTGTAPAGPTRRTSMSELQQCERRASIQQIMRDPDLTPLEKRRRVQNLMDGRRASYDCPVNPYLEMKARMAMQQQASNGDQVRRGSFHRRASSDSANVDAMDVEPMDSSMDRILSGTAPSDAQDYAKKHPYAASTTTVPMAGCSEATSRSARRSSIEFSKRAIETAPPCTHYVRKCHIVSPCCGATFGCRICHDDCPILPPLLSPDGFGVLGMGPNDPSARGAGASKRKYQRQLRTSSMPMSLDAEGPPEHHNVDRFAIREIICRECFTKQGSKTNFCVNCNVQFGEYHCAICNLWMSNEERPYHCPDCGFCRVGGGENFRHCQDCGMCIDRELFDDHNCQVGKYMSNCPVCQEDLFSSRDASHELPCGHAIHWHCFRELASHDSRCPCCKKTAETHERMKPTWDAMAMGIALQPVPPELAKVVTIKCNDCEVMQADRGWHFLGVQCRNCESFNTVVDRITKMGHEAHEFLLRVDPPVNAALLQRRRASMSAPAPPFNQQRQN